MQNADIEILINKIKDLDLAQSLTFITQNFVKGQIIFTTSLFSATVFSWFEVLN